ncbi:MAG: TetR/AcrR family transcriptional regulator [Gemmatimonadota bacterium]
MTPARSRPVAAVPEKPYHHGDLRRALLDAALRILRDEGISALTLRAVARAAGVSATAPYRHFPDRRALVAGVAEEGFDRLRVAMETAAGQGEGREGFRNLAFAYVEFAHAFPDEYRVMFGPEVAHHGDHPTLANASRSVLAMVAGGIRELQRAGVVRDGDPQLLAVTLWATLHGVVMLSLDGQSDEVAPSREALVTEATRTIMLGLAVRPA